MQIEEEIVVGRRVRPVEPVRKGRKVERVGKRLGSDALGLVEDSLVQRHSWDKP
jgi:hypothetical protein